jgi:hypothetical protein
LFSPPVCLLLEHAQFLQQRARTQESCSSPCCRPPPSAAATQAAAMPAYTCGCKVCTSESKVHIHRGGVPVPEPRERKCTLSTGPAGEDSEGRILSGSPFGKCTGCTAKPSKKVPANLQHRGVRGTVFSGLCGMPTKRAPGLNPALGALSKGGQRKGYLYVCGC